MPKIGNISLSLSLFILLQYSKMLFDINVCSGTPARSSIARICGNPISRFHSEAPNINPFHLYLSFLSVNTERERERVREILIHFM